MELELDRLVLAPWFNPYPRMTCNPYLTSSVQGQYTNFGNVVSLNLDQQPSFLHGSRVRAGILKPKAIRIASLHPFMNPRLCQGSFGTNFEEARCRTDNVVHSLGCSHSSIQGVSAQLNTYYPTFSYLSPCPYGINGHVSVIDAENVLKDMIRSQKQILYIHRTSSDDKRLEESRLALDANVLRASQHHTSTASSSLNQNSSHLQRDLLSPRTASHKCHSPSFKLHTQDSCNISNCQPLQFKANAKEYYPSSECNDSKRKQFCVQKQKQTQLKINRKRFMTPYFKTINHETSPKKKAEQATTSPNMDRGLNIFSEGASSQSGWLKSNIPIESSRSFRPKTEVAFQSNCNSFEKTEIPSKLASGDIISLKKVDKTVDGRVLYSQLPGFSEERKSFRCSQCRYLTDRKNNLKRHVVTMHQESSKILECCGVSFQNKAALRDHNSIFHRGGYRCQVCSRNFCRKALLRRHLTVHSGQKDFFCNICGYATSHKSNLERHQKVHAKREVVSDASRKGVSIKVGVRFRASSFSGVVIGSNRQTSPCGATRLAHSLPDHEAMKRYVDEDDVSQDNSYPTTSCPEGRRKNSPLRRTINELCNNRVHNVNTEDSKTLRCHNVLEINVTEKWDLRKADINVEVAATEDNGVTTLNQRSGEDNTSYNNVECHQGNLEAAS